MVKLITVRRIGRSGGDAAWRGSTASPVAGVVMVAVLALIGSACTVAFRDVGVRAGCGALQYRVDLNDVDLTAAQVDAIDDAVEEFGELVGRPVEAVDADGEPAAVDGSGGAILFELAWPDEEPAGLGFAEPHLTGATYDGGWIMLNPAIRRAPAGVIRRLVLHELGHLHGLADVEDPGELMDPSLASSDWGPGDLVGLLATHDGGCPGARLAGALAAELITRYGRP